MGYSFCAYSDGYSSIIYLVLELLMEVFMYKEMFSRYILHFN